MVTIKLRLISIKSNQKTTKESRFSNCNESNTRGEGKSTVTVGLSDAFNELKKNVMVALREPKIRTYIWY